jgi:hypothetical protein
MSLWRRLVAVDQNYEKQACPGATRDHPAKRPRRTGAEVRRNGHSRGGVPDSATWPSPSPCRPIRNPSTPMPRNGHRHGRIAPHCTRQSLFCVDLSRKRTESWADAIGGARSGEVPMLRILSALRFLHGGARRCASKALPLLLVLLACALGGGACRGDDTNAPPGATPELDDSDASPVAGTIQQGTGARC